MGIVSSNSPCGLLISKNEQNKRRFNHCFGIESHRIKDGHIGIAEAYWQSSSVSVSSGFKERYEFCVILTTI